MRDGGVDVALKSLWQRFCSADSVHISELAGRGRGGGRVWQLVPSALHVCYSSEGGAFPPLGYSAYGVLRLRAP